MLQKLPKNQQRGFISALYPQAGISENDSGLGSIGRIDHAVLNHSSIVPMHPHRNDEILSYFRQGSADHRDSEGIEGTAHSTRLMLMKAGRWFEHEEKINADGGFEGLQIFIRPKKADGEPSVAFRQLSGKYSDNQWRLLASPESELQFSSQSWVYDSRLQAGSTLTLPDFQTHLSYLLYVFNGTASVNGMPLEKRESVIIKHKNVAIVAENAAELVLFVTDENAEIFKGGMFSGNRF